MAGTLVEMQDPYRPHAPPPDPELARLAMQGQQRRAELAAGQHGQQQHAGSGHLRTAIGAYRGSTVKRIMLAVILVTVLTAGVGVVISVLGRPDIGGMLAPAFAIAFVTFMIYVFVPPLASQGAVNAEQDWARGLPFALEGYFEALGGQPRGARRIVYEIIWQHGARAPDPALVHGVFGAVDPTARLDHADARAAHVTGGAVSGVTGIRINRVPVYRNHRLPAHIHAVVEKVLLPLHRSHPIARVVLKG